MEFIKKEEIDEGIPPPPLSPDNLGEELDTLMDKDIDLSAPYSFCKVYPSTPNPGLHLSSLGYIGVPLNEREAQVLKSVATEAPYAVHGLLGHPGPLAGKSKGIWAIGADQVTFEGPQWKLFVDEIVEDVCASLDIRCSTSQLSWKMTNLVVCETGAHTEPDKSAPQSEGKIATFVIALPSKFTGGATHLSYGALRTTYDHSDSCPFEMTVMAWFQDVIPWMSPLTDGNKLVVTFDLSHTVSLPRPVCGTSGEFLCAALRILSRVARVKKERGAFGKALYLFPQLYADLKGVQDLNRLDSHKVQLLEMACCSVGLRVGFTTIRRWLPSKNPEGDTDDDGYEDSDSEEVKSSASCLYASEDEIVRAEDILSLDGQPILRSLEDPTGLTSNSLVILEKMKREEGKHMKGKVKEWVCCTPMVYFAWYRVTERVGLLFWPDGIEMQTKYRGNISAACEDAFDITSSTPSAIDLALKQYLFSQASESRCEERVVDALCYLGILWRDISVYTDALNICRDVMKDFILPSSREHDIVAAINCFGFEEVQKRLDTFLVDSTLEALRLLGLLQDQLATHSDEILRQKVTPWLRHHALNITAGIDVKEGSQGGAKILYSLITCYREFGFLKDKMLPRLLRSQNHRFLRTMASEIKQDERFQPTEMRTEIVDQLWDLSISHACTELRLNEKNAPDWLRAETKLGLAKEYIALCLETGKYHPLQSLLRALYDGTSSNSWHNPAKDIFIPLLTWSSKFTRNNDVWKSLPLWIELAEKCTTTFLDVTNKDVRIYLALRIAHFKGGSEYLRNSILPHIDGKILRNDECGLYASEVLDVFAGPEVTPEHDRLGSKLMAKYAKFVPLHGHSDTLNCFKNCLRFGDPSALSALVQRMYIIKPPRDWVTMHMTLFPDLMSLIDSPQKAQVLGPYFRAYFLWWMQMTLGRVGSAGRLLMPAQVARWSCSCQPCKAARSFIMEHPVKTSSTTIPRLKTQDKGHLNSHLQKLGGFYAEVETDKNGSHRLTVKFSADPVGALACCEKHQQEALEILKPLRTREEDLQAILGDQYEWVVSVLSGVESAESGKRRRPQCSGGEGSQPEGPRLPPRKRQKK